MALLEPRRVIADEGVPRTLRFVANVVRNPKARQAYSGDAGHVQQVPRQPRGHRTRRRQDAA